MNAVRLTANSMADTFDVVVIGAGPAGENVAAQAAKGGLSVALVESSLAGGECSYWACMPSKALLVPGDTLALAQKTPGLRVDAKLDVQAVFRHRSAMTHDYDDASQVKWIDSANVKLVRAHARFTGPRRLSVTDTSGAVRELEATKAVVLATGTRAAIPNIPGLPESGAWTNHEGTGSKEVPRRLLVLGGGPVAVELAQAWRSLGSESVTLIERGERLLSRMEPFASEMVRASLEMLGVQIRTKTALKSVRKQGTTFVATLEPGGEVQADRLLIATGRDFNTNDMGVETLGLTAGKPISVDDQCRAKDVAGGWLYAVGDVNGRNLLTHMGKYQARIAGRAILGEKDTAWADERAVTQVVFSNPQVASVGWTEAEAKKRGCSVKVITVNMEDTAGLALQGEALKGKVQIVLDTARNVLLGATFVGPGVGDMLHAATIAVVAEVPLSVLVHAVPCFPTVSEFWRNLLLRAEV